MAACGPPGTKKVGNARVTKVALSCTERETKDIGRYEAAASARGAFPKLSQTSQVPTLWQSIATEVGRVALLA